MRPDQPLRILEIGSYEGRSACWFSDNLLDHPESHLICVDTFEGGAEHQELELDLYRKWLANTKASKNADKIALYHDDSRLALAQILEDAAGDPFDLVYVDGSHESQTVLIDGAYAWTLARTGALIMFDDYHRPSFADRAETDPEPIKRAVAALLTIYPMREISDGPLMRGYVKET